ncbi:AraC family transcriptional regulator [Paenibacillus sp. LHD-38]|uniref:AraC family transcriptional regulator n=1 Tax=Paenibacillus sp. LHD-38 TaxID=3072143 RepID=UPI00280CE9A4|nr:AraC family transcriptional regulator [Paenibacillus sp. LHD-38]MDQ8733812.1 AraC family transcriptional regulator [Paenibacillus sp. LHD-38]
MTSERFEQPVSTVLDEFTNLFLAEYPVHCELRTGPLGRKALHHHDGYEIYLCLRGTGSYIVEENLYPLHAGTLTIIAPHVLHHPFSKPGQDFDRYVLSVSDSYLNRLDQSCPAMKEGIGSLLTGGVSGSHYFLPAPQFEQARLLLEELSASLASTQPWRELSMLRCMSELALLIIRKHEEPLAQREIISPDERLIGDVVAYLVAAYRDELHIDDLLRKFPVSRSRLFRLFKETTGYSIKRFLNEYRLNKAKGLLAQTSLPMIDVAGQTGFGDLSHFFHQFRTSTGMTPMSYRRQAALGRTQG